MSLKSYFVSLRGSEHLLIRGFVYEKIELKNVWDAHEREIIIAEVTIIYCTISNWTVVNKYLLFSENKWNV